MTSESQSRRPRVICHMMSSVDGRIVPGAWPLSAEARRQYELVHASYDADELENYEPRVVHVGAHNEILNVDREVATLLAAAGDHAS